ncbi:MAG: methylmalonyl Co-A mutase-associated GTPase MeaB [Hydrogenophilus sp.]|nr:methylmalonyl Co-A mutase-associated GTPase MeaB [Hydrogenophilus sp.]
MREAAQQEIAAEVERLAAGVLAGNRRALAKAITLIESERQDHRRAAEQLVERLLPKAGRAIRVGISGVPGVGKSTFIETLGLFLVKRGYQVAVLAVDPSSQRSGGSILGDRTRMERLSQCEGVFIRPSPTGEHLGGVAVGTRETIVAVEAAGYDVVMVETVGVGQSEVAVAGMTDLLVLLQLPHAGDELQGIKRGVMEWVDVVAVNKADCDPVAAQRTKSQLVSALALMRGGDTVPVLLVSALKGEGIAELWEVVESRWQMWEKEGMLATKRAAQASAWLWETIEEGLRRWFRTHPEVRVHWSGVEEAVRSGQMSPARAARRLLRAVGVEEKTDESKEER